MLMQSPNVAAVRPIAIKDHDTINYYSKTHISFPHILGMITCNITDYVLSIFNDGYFLTKWNSMEEPFLQRMKQLRDVLNKPNPSFMVLPEFDLGDESMFVPMSEFDEYIANDPRSNIRSGVWNSYKVMEYKNFALYAKPRRYKVKYSFEYLFDSDAERIAVQDYVRQSIRHHAPIQLHMQLENILPTNYMKVIAELNGFKDYTSEEFLKFVNSYSTVPISYRLRTGSSKYEFFAMLPSPVDILFPDAPESGGQVRMGNISIGGSFTDFCYVEFVAIPVYFLVTNVNPSKSIYYQDNSNTISSDKEMEIVAAENLFVKEFPVTDYIENNCVKLSNITIQPDKRGDDSINLIDNGLLKHVAIDEMIRHYLSKKKEIDFIHILLYEKTNLLDGSRYELNKHTMDLTIKDMDPYKLYYLYIYVDKSKINEDISNHFEPDMFGKI